MRVRVPLWALLQSRIRALYKFMYKVYLLQSVRHPEKSYVGMTNQEINERLKQHNNGESQFTKAYRPWVLIYFETFYCKLCADKREQFLKSGVGYRIRKIILENFKQKSFAEN